MTLSRSHNLYFLTCKMKELVLNKKCTSESDLKHVDRCPGPVLSPGITVSKGGGERELSSLQGILVSSPV